MKSHLIKNLNATLDKTLPQCFIIHYGYFLTKILSSKVKDVSKYDEKTRLKFLLGKSLMREDRLIIAADQ